MLTLPSVLALLNPSRPPNKDSVVAPPLRCFNSRNHWIISPQTSTIIFPAYKQAKYGGNRR